MLDLQILNDFLLKLKINISWIDIDILGHVNSSKYFTYFESARIKYYEQLGLWEYFLEQKFTGVVARTECNYFVPLSYPDNLIVGARITEIHEDHLVQEYFIKSELHGLSAIGEADIVFIDCSNNKKINVPKYVIERIAEFEKNKVAILLRKK
jgi:acyl-CoA thioester hydrolase